MFLELQDQPIKTTKELIAVQLQFFLRGPVGCQRENARLDTGNSQPITFSIQILDEIIDFSRRTLVFLDHASETGHTHQYILCMRVPRELSWKSQSFNSYKASNRSILSK